MFSMNFRDIISALSPSIIGDNWQKFTGAEKDAALFQFKISPIANGAEARLLDVIITSNCEVFYYYRNFSERKLKFDSMDWKFTSDHYSGWESSGLDFIDILYFELRTEIEPEKIPKDVRFYTTFAFFSNPKRVKVTIRRKITDSYYDSKYIESVGDDFFFKKSAKPIDHQTTKEYSRRQI